MRKTKDKFLQESNSFDFTVERTVEAEGVEPKWIISGPFTRANVPTLNKTIYRKEVLNKAISKIRSKVQSGRVRILIDHPEGFVSAGTPRLKDAAAQLIDLTDVQEDGYAYYRAQILDNVNGEILKSILKVGGKIGVSTRGWGGATEDEYPPFEGKYRIIDDDYELETIDFVDDPAVAETERDMKFENKHENNNSRSEKMKTAEELKSNYPELVAQLEKSAKADLEKEVATYKSVVERVATEIKTAKPDIVTVIQESEVVSIRDKEIKSLVEKIASLEKALTEAKKNAEIAIAKAEMSEKESKKNAVAHKIAELRAGNEEMFGFDFVEKSFEACQSVDEVVSVFEHQKHVIDSFKSKIGKPAPAKSDSTKQETVTLSAEKTAHFNALNIQRKALGLAQYTVEDFLKLNK